MPVKKKPPTAVAEETPPRRGNGLSNDVLIDLLRQMMRIRRLEERAAQAYGQGKIGGFCHLYIGQEAVAVGAVAASRPDDYVITTYRDHGLALLRGVTPEAVFAELFGRVAGCSKGRGGSMHMFDRDHNFLGGHGIVGAHIPLGTGAAFASKYRGEDRVTLCFLGDGAVPNGNFHEALNLASLWNLPIVYLCENNKYGMGTSVDRISKVSDLHRKAEAYNMAHSLVDGMDVLAVHDAVKAAVDDARQGIPAFLEVRTYRFRGHSMSDPATYRTKEEVECYRDQDPIAKLSGQLEADGILPAERLQALDREISQEVKAAMEIALASPEPDPRTVYDYIYQQPPRGFPPPLPPGAIADEHAEKQHPEKH